MVLYRVYIYIYGISLSYGTIYGILDYYMSYIIYGIARMVFLTMKMTKGGSDHCTKHIQELYHGNDEFVIVK